ncbi:sulfite exporter TauE/SafE family protein [Neptunomonas sp.]|uniref:sulfite exporter TauE/SafE family protein n=1 Tax=Neptunomonas sp. TaxID=1971898 RepID=UPI0025DCC14D|nr:sulfite exporter TauE/SafE family protein [Neptunomonas sp.]
MIESLSISTAILLGLLGSAHCLGMCGGIAATIALGQQKNRIPNLIGYNFGRLLSYAVAGALVGSIGVMVKDSSLAIMLRTIAGLLLIAMGLYVAQWWKGLTHVERLGSKLWTFISPAASKLLPVKNIKQALLLGFFWGWLPCGLVYSTLIWSATANDPVKSASLMFAFGIGTLPAMLSTGMLAKQMQALLSNRNVQHIAGLMIIIFGFYTIPFNGIIGI